MTIDLAVAGGSGIAISSIADWPADELAVGKAGQRVAVVLPARNEAATVGDIVASIAAEHTAGDWPLVDELIVVDSGSTDATAAIAASAGARVVRSPRPGKGEAMWHGTAATDADLVVFIDADLEQFDPRFVPALVGPLLAEPGVGFVKGTYDRRVSGASPTGGGRVTELMARPLLSAFWPELAGVVQPLSGEYAVRRSLLERLPFRCGYGVDIGLLIDGYLEVGAAGLAQVDLYRRQHRHSELADLGRMAAEILHTVLDRLALEGRIACDVDALARLAQPCQVDGVPAVAWHDVDVTERPPLRG